MIHVKKNTQSVDHLDDTALRWLGTDHGESAVKSDIEEKWNSFLNTIDIEIDGKYRFRRRNRFHLRWVTAVSVVVLLIVVGLWHYGGHDEITTRNTFTSQISEDIRLTLPDGEQILLNPHTENGIIAKRGGVSLIRQNGTLIHEKEDIIVDSESELQWGSVEVPRGNQFDLVLEDGTQVWLNADSRLRFPIAFGEDERRVFIEGEGYFAVATDHGKPFVVETLRQDITVSGTEFNIYAYPDEEDELTTLIEGCVILTSRGNESVILAPGQQAVLQFNKYIIREVDAQNSAAWRNGFFVLDGNTFGEVFLKLSRWYGFTYSFNDEELAQLTFSGDLRKYDDADAIFDILETIAHVKINVKGDRVGISNK